VADPNGLAVREGDKYVDPAFKDRRRQTLEKMLRAHDANDDDKYCEGYDELIATEREAGEFDEYEFGMCRVCGCTEFEACPGGCGWADETHTLCTNCVDKVQAGNGGGEGVAAAAGNDRPDPDPDAAVVPTNRSVSAGRCSCPPR
jgi:hypothetical protein